MITVTVLLENTAISRDFQKRHGLSLAIARDDETVLLDVGPDARFLRNSRRLGVDVSAVDTLLLSHHHIDHTGGLDAFCHVNDHATIHLCDHPSEALYIKALQRLRIPIGLRCSASTRARLVRHETDLQLDERTHFLRHTVHRNPRPSLNANLFMRADGSLRPDDFDHEGVLVMIEGDEMVLFNSCSHNGVINSIQTAQRRFPHLRVRSYVGGFHFRDPLSGRMENRAALDAFADWFRDNDIRLFTGHCTGAKPLARLQDALGADRVRPIRTGMVIGV